MGGPRHPSASSPSAFYCRSKASRRRWPGQPHTSLPSRRAPPPARPPIPRPLDCAFAPPPPRRAADRTHAEQGGGSSRSCLCRHAPACPAQIATASPLPHPPMLAASVAAAATAATTAPSTIPAAARQRAAVLAAWRDLLELLHRLPPDQAAVRRAEAAAEVRAGAALPPDSVSAAGGLRRLLAAAAGLRATTARRPGERRGRAGGGVFVLRDGELVEECGRQGSRCEASECGAKAGWVFGVLRGGRGVRVMIERGGRTAPGPPAAIHKHRPPSPTHHLAFPPPTNHHPPPHPSR